jgi:class 3 adenylate cyclase
MFCNLVGSTELSARLDPEDLREVIGAYHRAVADVIRGFDGLVAKYMGDGVLVYFGYPRAHEDDTEWAVRAANRVPAVVMPSCSSQHRAGMPADPDWRVRLLHREGFAADIGVSVEPTTASAEGSDGNPVVFAHGMSGRQNGRAMAIKIATRA